MINAFSLREVESLEKDDWVWIVDKDDAYRPGEEPCGEYYKVSSSINHHYLEVSSNGTNNYYKFYYEDYCKTWVAYKNREQFLAKEHCTICHKDVSDELPKVDIYGNRYCRECYEAECRVELINKNLPEGWLDVLKLLTCAAMCYSEIDGMIANGMKDSKDLAELFFKIPRVQGTILLWSLEELVKSNLDCNKITGFKEILEAMPRFKKLLDKQKEQVKEGE